MAITGDKDAGKGKQHKPANPLIPMKEIIRLEDIDDTINDEDYSDKKEGSAVLGVVEYEGVATGVTTTVTIAAATMVADGVQNGDVIRRAVAGVIQPEIKRLTVGSITATTFIVMEDGVAAANGDFQIGDTVIIVGVSQYFSDGPETDDDWVSPKESITPA